MVTVLCPTAVCSPAWRAQMSVAWRMRSGPGVGVAVGAGVAVAGRLVGVAGGGSTSRLQAGPPISSSSASPNWPRRAKTWCMEVPWEYRVES